MTDFWFCEPSSRNSCTKKTPAIVRQWIVARPKWLDVREVPEPRPSALAGLDAGEAGAIHLAQKVCADLLLLDERRAANLARQQGLEVTGTLGVLLQAARKRLIVLDEALLRLQSTDFRCTPHLFDEIRRASKTFSE
jgi:predicted nucleic acid-binding protein